LSTCVVMAAQVAAGGDLSPCYQATAKVETLSGLSAPSCTAFHRAWRGACLRANEAVEKVPFEKIDP
jgi:hypothetical protein